MSIGLLYALVVIIIAAFLGLFEVWGITHYRVGWGEPLPPEKPWAKPLIQKAPFNLVGIQLLTRYHFFVFFMLVPIAVVALSFALLGFAKHPPASLIGWLIWVVAGTMGVMVVEDFLFFAFSSIFGKPYPRALTRLFRGEATWHPGQINFGWFVLPANYLWVPAAVILLLLLEARFFAG